MNSHFQFSGGGFFYLHMGATAFSPYLKPVSKKYRSGKVAKTKEVYAIEGKLPGLNLFGMKRKQKEHCEQADAGKGTMNHKGCYLSG